MYSSERNMWKQPLLLDQNKAASNPEFYKLAKQTIDNPFADPQFILESSINLYLNGYKEEGKELLEKLAVTYPRNFDVLQVNAGLYEEERDFIAAISYRERISKIDPYNALNYLILGQDYKNIGDLRNKKLVLEKILSFAPNTPEAQRAIVDLA
jgi:tetratricopeptide (TPR) repeat protein